MPTLLYFLEQQIKPGLIVENDDNYYNWKSYSSASHK